MAPITITGIRLSDVRTFAGEHLLRIAPGLTVLVGRNNAGKSTVLRAPFLVNSSGPVASYRRSGSAVSEIGLEVRIAAGDLEKFAGFPAARIRDVGIARGSDPADLLVNTPAFSRWEHDPLVEFGWSLRSPDSISRTIRCVSNDVPGAFLELSTSAQPRARLGPDDEPVVRASTDWFAEGFGAFYDASAGRRLSSYLLAHWEHERTERVSDWISSSAHGRRLVDTGESRLQETLTFLRMKHPAEFDRVSEALARALPEFQRLDFIDVSGKGFSYRPAFVARGHGADALARENIGSGAWTFLCILTAARAAKATGARLLMLDEPHLYLHPGLERLLIDELLDASAWDGQPLQIIAATHSPVFVDAAVERGTLHLLDWSDETRTSVSLRTVSYETAGSIFDALTSRPSELLYADRLVFVEGPSDIVALRILARERCGSRTSARYVPLKETDAIASEVARYFHVIIQGHGLGFRVRGVLVLDGDKKADLEAAWDKLDASLDPRKVHNLRIVWATAHRGNDIESVFCDEDFLVAYFEHQSVDTMTSRPLIALALAKLKYPASHRAQKGCTAIRELHETLLGASRATKADDLEALMHFYCQHAEDAYSQAPRERLEALESALREFDKA